MRDKAGLSTENTFLEWSRRVHSHSEMPNTVSMTLMPCSSATEHVGSRSFKALAEDLLSNDLNLAQRGEKKYMIRRNTETGEIIVTNQQRSWINVVLRKNLEDANGLPALLDVSLRSSAPRKAMLQNMLEELVQPGCRLSAGRCCEFSCHNIAGTPVFQNMVLVTWTQGPWIAMYLECRCYRAWVRSEPRSELRVRTVNVKRLKRLLLNAVVSMLDASSSIDARARTECVRL